MSKSNNKKSQQLGMPHGTATGRLRKMVLFSLLQEGNKDICFQCGEKIEEIEELSIEHKVPWLDSEDPAEVFFDLENIAFSHLSCNVGAARKQRTTKEEKLQKRRDAWANVPKETRKETRRKQYLRTGN